MDQCHPVRDSLCLFSCQDCSSQPRTSDSRCYIHVRGNATTRISWLAANAECVRRGGYLASLNTPCEKRVVTVAMTKSTKTNRGLMVGLKSTYSTLPFYAGMVMWEDGTIAYYVNADWKVGYCGRTTTRYGGSISTIPCGKPQKNTDFLCEIGGSPSGSLRRWRTETAMWWSYGDPSNIVRLWIPRNQTLPVPYVTCPTGGHLTHVFLACDPRSACWWSPPRRNRHGGGEWRGIPPVTSCSAPMTSLPPMFACDGGGGGGVGSQRVPYSLVCDHRLHCADGSDESFCVFPPCSGSTPMRCPSSSQCIKLSSLCDLTRDCLHGQDEDYCLEVAFTYQPGSDYAPPGIIRFRRKLWSPVSWTPQVQEESVPCPETHFKCPSRGYCLPVVVLCNGVKDCPGWEDEAACDSGWSCPGFYRCRGSKVCLHPTNLCDGVSHCTERDDELFCNIVCPAGCTCHALAFTCHDRPSFPAAEGESLLVPGVRYLDVSGSRLKPSGLRGDALLLIHLGLSHCGLQNLSVVRHHNNLTFTNLRSLDLSFNELDAFSADHLQGMLNLRYLALSSNPLKTLFVSAVVKEGDQPLSSFPALASLDLSGVTIEVLNTAVLSHFPGLQIFNLSRCGIDRVTGNGLGSVVNKLRVLDAAECPMTRISRGFLTGLDRLEQVRSSNFKMCCAGNLPERFRLENCRSPSDEISSCQSLLRSDVYRAFIAVFASFALLGNVGCFVIRNFFLKKSASGFAVFVSHLSVSDFLMGVYLTVIAVADSLYRGTYLWEDVSWRQSMACSMAGVFSLLSNEVSAFIICLITLDRFLVLRFPFSRLHFRVRSAHVTCGAVWVFGSVMAAIPLTPMTSNWSFYSQTGICIPLPVTRRNFAGQGYAFGVMVVLNFVIFLLVALGQAVIYDSIRADSRSALLSQNKPTATTDNLRIARRLISVAVSDFLCWFPIGLLGLLASKGVPIPGEVNVAVAILVLPLNSALNPFLYTINVVLARRAKARDDQLLNLLKDQLDDGEAREMS